MENSAFSLVQLASKKVKIGEYNTQNGSDTKIEVNIPGTSTSAINEVTDNDTNDTVSVAVKSPLQLLPEELWELVLNHLESSHDIFNCLRAFPDLDKLFHNKKPNWLFDLILPHILTKHLVRKQKHGSLGYLFLRSKEFYQLRQVSKRWKYAVENCIQNHPDSPTQSPAEKTVTENHFNYYPIQKYNLGATKFHSPNQIDGFMENMKDYNGNPFPGKFVLFESIVSDCDDWLIVPTIIPKLEKITEKFGQYIHILNLEIISYDEFNLEIFKGVLSILGNVPNIKSLTVRAELDAGEDETTNDFFNQAESQQLFPKLKFLTTFNWYVRSDDDSSWNDRMINTYVKQGNLSKLSIDPKFLNPELGLNLTRLKELHIFLDRNNEYDIHSIRNVVSCFTVGQIQKFGISYHPFLNYETEIYVNSLLQILDQFQIKTVVFDGMFVKESPNLLAQPDSSINTFRGITTLYLNDILELSYQFLQQLPNLRFLYVFVDYVVYREISIKYLVEQKSFANSLRTYFFQACIDEEEPHDQVEIPTHFSIWNELPKLEMLSVSVNNANEILDVQFVKEHGNIPFFGYRRANEGEYGY